MFSRCDGPTHLRPELVRALAFSLEHGQIQTQQGSVRVRAGLVGVWNGSVGQVLVLIQLPDYGCVDRWAFERRINSEAGFSEAVQAGLASAECLVLSMDDPGFLALDPQTRSDRLELWEELRKPALTPDVCAKAPTIELPPPPGQDLSDLAVLGRVSVVRRRVNMRTE